MGENILLPSIAISGSIAHPGKTRVFPPGFSRVVNTLPTLAAVLKLVPFPVYLGWYALHYALHYGN